MTNNRKHPEALCEQCPLYEKGRYVPPDYNGNTTAKYLLVGEAPGATEAKKGKPFVGISGKLLDETMKEEGIDRKQAALTNVCLCRPANNATPTAKAIAACKPALDSVVKDVQPEYVVAMGNTAATAFLGRPTKITQDRVGPPKVVEGQSYRLIPTVHPAATLRNTNLFPLFAADIGKLHPRARVIWEPPQYKAVDNEVQGAKVLRELLSRTRMEFITLDLEVGEDKDDSFGHPNTLLAAGIGYEKGKVAVLGERVFASPTNRKMFSSLIQANRVICHNGKYDLGVLYRMNYGTFTLGGDTMLMAYTQDEMKGGKGLEYLSQEKLGIPSWKHMIKPYTEGKNGSWSNIPKPLLYQYNAYDVAATWDLYEMFYGIMDEHDHKLHEFLCWASDQLMIIESEGIYIDRMALDMLDMDMQHDLKLAKVKLQEQVKDIMAEFDERIRGLIAKNKGFNPNSTDQVKAALEYMTGATLSTTDADMLDMLTGHRKQPVVQFATDMLEWRKVSKLWGTYVKGTLERLGEDGRTRTSFLLHGTETGRLSSRNPNVQNVPRESKYANIRSIYSTAPGNRIIYGDYSNIEGRIVAILSNDQNMKDVLCDSSRDIHSEVAAMIFGSEFNYEQRVKAKSVVHGKNYDRTAHGIASDPKLGLSIKEADKISRTYDRMFPNVRQWHKSIYKRVLDDGETLITPWGRKRRFGLIVPDNVEDVYKEALAFQPQSIGSDICLTAGIRLRALGFHVRILIHDGIVVEVPEHSVDDAIILMRKVMEEAAEEFTEEIPFPVEINVGASWGEVD